MIFLKDIRVHSKKVLDRLHIIKNIVKLAYPISIYRKG